MIITETLQKEFTGFLATVPARRLKHNTFRILLYYFRHKPLEGLPDYMDDLIEDMAPFFALLDSIDGQVDQSHLL